MDLYTLNKIQVANMPDASSDQIENLKMEITKWWNSVEDYGYFMLLGRDLNYYTLFRWKAREHECLADLVVECLENIGKIKTWVTYPDKIELWIKTPMPLNECYSLYLFPYSDGVVHFGG